VLVPVRVEVKRSRIRHVASGIIGNNRDIIPYLALVRIALERIKGIAHRNVRRPGHAGVGAKGIEQLRVCVIGSVSRVIPNSVESPVGRYRKCAKPVPLVRINRVVVDLHRRAEG
jgi:hypothetical protein